MCNGKQPVYPGCCSQCNMKNHGSKTILFDLAPNIQIRICDRCYAQKRDVIQDAITEAQTKTCFIQLMSIISYDEELIIPCGLWYESGWKIHPQYKILYVRGTTIYVPVIKNEKTIFVKMEDLLFMNGKTDTI